ncbi:MAG: polyprenyl synthetase family protein [Candidatus Aenigmatarchaeota archaeon]
MIDLEKLSKEKAPLIDKELASVFSGNMPNLHDAIKYHLGTGGKRLRPLLSIVTYEALGGSDNKILPFAAACELLHNWFLVHDDIMDGDRMRRDKPTVWVKYGLAHGINVGDYMAQKVFELIINSRNCGVDDKTVLKLVDAMVTTSVKTSEGQTMDINMRSGSPKESDYLAMVMAKTGHYLTVPMVGAALVAGREEIIPKLIEFGSFIGPAFQIADDILDLTEGKGRGETGRDIKEGKKSILIIHCLGKCNAKEKKLLLEILEKTPEATSDDDVRRAISMLNKYNSLDYAKKRAEELKKKAYVSIKKMPPELQETLNFFADYLVNRKK